MKIVMKEFQSNSSSRPFVLLPPLNVAESLKNIDVLESYIEIILKDCRENERTFLGAKGAKDRNYQKYLSVRNLYWDYFNSFEELREVLKSKKLEKLAKRIEMQPNNERGSGILTFLQKDNIKRTFGLYVLK